MKPYYIKLFLRIALALGFLSAVADRLGLWGQEVSVWGNWQNFQTYTQSLVPYMPEVFIPFIAIIITLMEVVLALLLIIGFRIKITALVSGYLLLVFAVSMTLFYGIKGTFDYAVFTAAAAAMGLSTLSDQ